MKIHVEPATAQILASAGVNTLPKSVRAIAFTEAGTVIGWAGLYVDGPRLVMFGELSDRIREEKRALVRGYRQLLAVAARLRLPVHAKPDDDVPAAKRFLEHMGFTAGPRGIYQWHR